MQRRVFGLETEYGVTCTGTGSQRLSPDEVARYLFRKVVSWGRSSNVFLANGARLYLDVGSHPEYATPECDSLEDLIASDAAGVELLRDLVDTANAKLTGDGLDTRIYLFRNNTDTAGNSYGCHENYLGSRDVELAEYTSFLVPFVITRQIYAGAGKLLRTPRGMAYTLTQRAEHIWEGVSSATTRSRPIINTRDEPHANADIYRRLHVIAGDTNMNQYASYLKMGATSLMLRIIEDPYSSVPLVRFENPIRAIREISADTTLKQTVRLANGHDVSALDIQERYFECAHEFGRTHDLEPQEKQSLQMWEHILAGLRRNPMSMHREIDWVTKLTLLDAFRERHDVSLNHPRSQLVALQYHDIDADRSVFYKTQRRGHIETIVSDDQVSDARHTAPRTTRAHLRGGFVAAANENKSMYTVDWVHLKLNDQKQKTVLLKDPFENENARVDDMIAQMRNGRSPQEQSDANL